MILLGTTCSSQPPDLRHQPPQRRAAARNTRRTSTGPAHRVSEVCYLLSEWGGPDAEVRFLRDFRPGGLRLAELTDTDVARMADLAERYANLRLGGTDASIIATAERLGIHRIAMFDRRHFTVVRPSHVEAFTLLPEATSSSPGERPGGPAVSRGYPARRSWTGDARAGVLQVSGDVSGARDDIGLAVAVDGNDGPGTAVGKWRPGRRLRSSSRRAIINDIQQ